MKHRLIAAVLMILPLVMAAPAWARPPRGGLFGSGGNAAARANASLPSSRAPAVGDRGLLVNRRATVVQIIDASNALANVEWSTTRHEVMGDPRRGIVVDHTEPHAGMVWLRMSTAGLTNGQAFTSNQTFAATGTTTYQTTRGAWTLVMLQMEAPPPAPVAAPPAAAAPR
jgi:hypothetical protein